MKKAILLLLFIALFANVLYGFDEPAPGATQYINIALHEATNAVASSTYGNFTADRAIDNNIDTSWASQLGTSTEYLFADLGTKVYVDGFKVEWHPDYYATHYKVRYSEDYITWHDAKEVTAGDGSKLIIPIDAKCRYIGVQCFERVNQAFAVRELGVYIEDTFVKASGNILMQSGIETVFKGVSFTNFYYEDNITAYVGVNPQGTPLPQIFTNVKHHQQEDFNQIKAMGFNTVRFALNADWFSDNVADDSKKLWTWIDNSIEMARDAGIGLVIDMHEPVGQSWLDWDTIKNTPMTSTLWMWNDPAKVDKLIRIWDEIARRYKHETTIVGLQLLNEPMTTDPDFNGVQWFGDGDTIKGLAQTLIETVRAHDSNHLIVMDDYCGSLKAKPTSEEMAKLLQINEKVFSDTNILYDRHFYEMGYYTHKAAFWGGGIDNGSVYNDESAPLGKPIWDRHNLGNGYTWSRLAASNLKNLSNTDHWVTLTSNEYTPSTGDVVLDCKAVVQGNLGLNNAVLFDNFVLFEKKAGEQVFSSIRVMNPDKPFIDNSVRDTQDGFHGWIEAPTNATEEDKKFTEENSFHVFFKHGSGDSTSVGITNNKVKAVWNQSWMNIAVNPTSTYMFSVEVKVIGQMPAGVVAGPVLEAVQDPKGIIQRGFNKTTLRNYINGQILKFQTDNNLPKSFFEFGAMEACFIDPKTGANNGGAEWLQDVISIYDENNASWIFWAFRNKDMGMFTEEEYKERQMDYIDWTDTTLRNPEIYQTIQNLPK